MYTLTKRSCPFNVIFAIFARYLQRPRELMIEQETKTISFSSAISSKRSEEQSDQLMSTGQIS